MINYFARTYFLNFFFQKKKKSLKKKNFRTTNFQNNFILKSLVFMKNLKYFIKSCKNILRDKCFFTNTNLVFTQD